ncbi:microtubule binding motor protein [Lithospermum erythrorhizon]|uniref:Microtubule binding motor protein n=1 Tax=Lithospermum erythrorhizon TaxID=34254 RepID=A0AAV3NZH4_LITER
MENAEGKDTAQCVRVAVNIRPLLTPELMASCTDIITVTPGQPQVQIGSHAFTFDYVFGNGGLPSLNIFDECVAPLVEELFHGYNGTVLAYGQTGSGKTYTMGTNYNGDDFQGGVIPKVMEGIFSRVESMRNSTEFLIRVSFIEIFKEDVFDLLDSNCNLSKIDGLGVVKQSGLSRNPIQIRETVSGGITLAGVTEAEVKTKEEMASYLLHGSVARATASTNMNSQSSRSHAIFTICLEQKGVPSSPVNGAVDDILSSKLHLVDLAGSERAKRTGADGMRLREGIHINKGLLALGNVISALGDEKKRKEGGHVPYRDSKLTRLLQDSLGGNSKTVMIACVSPADTNAEETLNTLKYANRARNIQNKAIINRDPATAQLQRMRSEIEQLQTELSFFRGDSTTTFEELQTLKHKISLLEASNVELRRELQERQISCEHLSQRAIDAQVERDMLVMKIESARNGKPWSDVESVTNEESDLLKNYISKIQELEGELLRLQSSKTSKKRDPIPYTKVDGDMFHSKSSCGIESEMRGLNISGEIEDEAKVIEHSSLQEKLDRELKELDQRLEQKEAEMKRFACGDTSVLKTHYEKKVQELELEKRALQKEIEELRNNLANISSSSDDSAQNLKKEYLQKLNSLEAQVAELKKKQDSQAQILRQKQKSDEAAKRLHDEIHRIKTQKVQLQQKIKQESEQFRLWKASREKEVLQLKKEGRRNEYEMHKLLALNQRQKMVMQRKTEEATMATKRLKELLESRKPAREISGVGTSSGPTIQGIMQVIEHELEVTTRVHEVHSEYERQMEERAKMAKELIELKEEVQSQKERHMSGSAYTMSPGARNSRIYALENMLATSSSSLVSMASQLSEAEECERTFNGKGRWHQVRSLAVAKNTMNFLFNLASSARCQLKDQEISCREKDSEIRDLKEKVVNLGNQLELQKADWVRREKLMILATQKLSREKSTSQFSGTSDSEGHAYDFQPKGLRNSIIHNELLEDMDISESENSSNGENDNDSDWDCNGVCCSCSKQSSCKTRKCECRAAKGLCRISCGCESTRCSNRVRVSTEEENDNIQSVLVKDTITIPDDDKSHVLASQGAMLLQCALSENPNLKNDDVPKRKPLSDIANTQAKLNIPNPGQRKKWKNPVFQLVPTSQPTAEIDNSKGSIKQEDPIKQQSNDVAAVKEDESTNKGASMPLKLPRAMRLAQTSNNTLKERNSDQQHHDATIGKDSGLAAPRSPRQWKILNDKENEGA